MEQALKDFISRMEKAAPGLAVDEREGEGEGEVLAGEFNLNMLEMLTLVAAVEVALVVVTDDFLMQPDKRAGAATFGLELIKLKRKLVSQFQGVPK